MARHNETGSRGERLAREHLLTLGYTIIDTNVKIGHYEIDFVSMHGSRIVFVEVKTRSSDISDPTDAIDERKMRRLCIAADSYIRTYDIPHEPQFDVITIIDSPDTGKEPVLEHFPDAFRPPLSGAR